MHKCIIKKECLILYSFKIALGQLIPCRLNNNTQKDYIIYIKFDYNFYLERSVWRAFTPYDQ